MRRQGGGAALLHAREGITFSPTNSDDFNYGKKLVYSACGKPFETILTNAGHANQACADPLRSERWWVNRAGPFADW